MVNKWHQMHATDFRLLCARADELEEKDIDEKIRPLVKAINASDGLVTVFSCQGHEEDAEWNQGYVMIGVRDLDHMEALYQRIRWKFKDNQHLVGVTQTTRQNFLGKPIKRTGKQPWWPVWNLHWKLNSVVSREQAWEWVNEAAIDFEEWLKGVQDEFSTEK